MRSCLGRVRRVSTLVLGELSGSALSPGTLSAITAAKALKHPISLLLSGKGAKAGAAAAAQAPGLARVISCEGATAEYGVAENVVRIILGLHEKSKFSHILGTTSNYSKNILPRVAVKLDSAPITDVVKIHDASTFERPMYAGNAIARVTSSDAIKVLTIRPTSFEKSAASGAGAGACALEEAAAPSASTTSVLSEAHTKSERPELGSATKVVSGGRAMKSGENFQMLYTLADKIGAAVGASRAAVDAGYVPNDMQVGQTGKVVAPQLYLAVGISGAIQHMAGMKDSKVIAAINKDAEAPIMQVADYALVEDLFKAVPEFTSKLK